MKRIKAIVTTIIVAMLCTLISLCLLACGNGEQSKQLSASQNLQVTAADILEWDKVDNATEYLVDINGEEYHTDTNSLDIFLLTDKVGEYKISVTACDGTGKYVLSEQSKTLKYNIEKPDYLKIVHRIGNTNEYRITGVTDKAAAKGKVIIPSETEDGFPITEIASSAFKDCTAITSVIVPDNVANVASNAFSSCENLRRIDLSESVSRLGVTAFGNCKSLTKIRIPQSVTQISYSLFSLCESLTELMVDENNVTYKSDGNCIIQKADNVLVAGCSASVIPDYVTAISNNAFSGCVGLKEITIPKNIQRLEDGVFNGCTSLKKVTIPESVQSIGVRAFYGCTSLKEITVPKSVQSIGESAFSKCTELTKIELADGVQKLDRNAFSESAALTAINIPQSVNSIHGMAFSNCPKLTNITIDDKNPVYKSDGNCIIQKSDNQIVLGCVASVIPSYVKRIGNFAFTWIAVNDFIVPEGVEEIGAGAFSSETLQRIELPSTLKILGDSAFGLCNKLQDVALPIGLISIGKGCFSEYNRCSITLPGEVQAIGETAFLRQTIYTSATTRVPEGWFHGDHSNGEASWCTQYNGGTFTQINILYNCELGEDNGMAYVKSYTYKTASKGQLEFTIFASSPNNIRVPYRKGYTFMGWATEEDSDVVVYPNTEHTDSNGKTYYTTLTKEQRDTIPSGTTLYAVWQKQE